VFLFRKDLGKPVGRHISGRELLYVEPAVANFLSDLALMDIDVLELGVELLLLLRSYIYSLLVTILNNRYLIKFKVKSFK
jgi:hypothetical protein